MRVEDLIRDLAASDLYAECSCGEEFRIGDGILFDGTKTFPPNALQAQSLLIEQLDERIKELEKKIKRATEGAQRTAAAVNIGKSLEKVLPIAKDFKWVVADSKALGDPIDLVVFNGLSNGRVESLSFVEVKSGAAKLNGHQKSIRDAIRDRKVSFGVFV